MALARIITRSDTCSRELAFDLLGRGYAVEIVTPDSIPSHRADLELRVETGAGDCLIASVIARDGERSASLEFVRQLKAPILDPAFAPAALNSDVERAVGSEAVQSSKTAELTAEASTTVPNADPVETMLAPASEPVMENKQEPIVENTPEIKPETKKDAEVVKNVAQPIYVVVQEAMPNPLPSLATQPPGNFASASSMIMRPPAQAVALRGRVEPVAKRLWDVGPPLVITSPKVQLPALSRTVQAAAKLPEEVHVPPPIEPQSFDSQSYERHNYNRSPGLPLTVAVTLTSMALLLTLVFGLSVRRRTPSPIPVVADGVAPSGTGASAAPGTNRQSSVVPTADSGKRRAHASPLPASAAASKPEEHPAPAAKSSSITKVTNATRASTAIARAKSSYVRGDQMIARDTVTYLDRPKAAVPQKSPVGLNANDRRIGVVAENTVTHLNGTSGNPIQPAPKAAK